MISIDYILTVSKNEYLKYSKYQGNWYARGKVIHKRHGFQKHLCCYLVLVCNWIGFNSQNYHMYSCQQAVHGMSEPRKYAVFWVQKLSVEHDGNMTGTWWTQNPGGTLFKWWAHTWRVDDVYMTTRNPTYDVPVLFSFHHINGLEHFSWCVREWHKRLYFRSDPTLRKPFQAEFVSSDITISGGLVIIGSKFWTNNSHVWWFSRLVMPSPTSSPVPCWSTTIIDNKW